MLLIFFCLILKTKSALAELSFDFSQSRGKTDLFSEIPGGIFLKSPIFSEKPLNFIVSSSVSMSNGTIEYLKNKKNLTFSEINNLYNNPAIGQNSLLFGATGERAGLYFYNMKEIFAQVSNPVFPTATVFSTETKAVAVGRSTNRINGISFGSSVSFKKTESEFLRLDVFDLVKEVPDQLKSKNFMLNLSIIGSYLIKSPEFSGELRIRTSPEMLDIKRNRTSLGSFSVGSKFSLIPKKLNVINITTQLDYLHELRNFADFGGAIEYESPESIKFSIGSNKSGITAGAMSSFYGLDLKFGTYVPGLKNQDRHIKESELRYLRLSDRIYSVGVSFRL